MGKLYKKWSDSHTCLKLPVVTLFIVVASQLVA